MLARPQRSATCCFDGATGTCKDPARLSVCMLDPYCCSTAWDDQCVAEFEDVTGWLCPPVFEGYVWPSGATEIAAWDDMVCEESEQFVCEWEVYFDLPMHRPAGQSTVLDSLSMSVHCQDDSGGFGGGGGGGPDERVEILANVNGVVRGLLRTDFFFDLSGACEQSIDGVLLEVRPPPPNGCTTTAATPGCNDPGIQTCVCRDDEYCCAVAWDGACVTQVSGCHFF